MSSATQPVRQLSRRVIQRARFTKQSYTFRELLKANPGYRATFSQGQWHIADVTSRLPRSGIKQANLDLVTDLLAAQSATYFVVPTVTQNRTRLGVPEQDRDGVLARLTADHGKSPLYVDIYRDSGTTRRVLAADLPGLLQADDPVRLVRIYRFYAWPNGAMVAGSLHATELEFWTGVEAALIAPFGNRVSRVVPKEYAATATVAIGDRTLPTLEPFADPTHVDLLDFPVDLVFGLPARDSSDRAPLRRALRSLWMHGEAFRRIHVVVKDQAPGWLNAEHPAINIVRVGDLEQHEGVDPRLAANQIEGLSERYVLADDNLCLRRPFRPAECYLSNGISLVFVGGPLYTPRFEQQPSSPIDAVRRGEELFAIQSSGRQLNRASSPAYPLIREVVTEVCELAPKTPDAGTVTPADVQYHAFATARAVLRTGSHVLVDPASLDVAADLRRASASATFEVVGKAGDAPAVRQRLGQWYPLPSPYERVPAAAQTPDA